MTEFASQCTASPLEQTIGFARVCRRGNTIAVSGTAPIEKGETQFVGDLYHQTRFCLSLSMSKVVEAGGKEQQIIRTRIMLTDVSRWKEAAKAHQELLGHIRPA